MSDSQKHPVGRPSSYDPKYCEEILKYFDIEPYRVVEITHSDKQGRRWLEYEERANDLPTLAGFAAHIKVNRDTLKEWAKVHPEFSAAYKHAKELQERILVTNALKNLYAQPFAVFTAKNILGWRDKTDTEISGKNGGPIEQKTETTISLDERLNKALEELKDIKTSDHE